VVVKPDGTIVSSEAAAVDEATGRAVATETTVTDEAAAESLAMAPTDDDTAAIATAGGLSTNGELEITPLPDVATLADTGPAVDTLSQPPAEPAPAQAPAAAEPTIVATGGSNGPIDVTPGQPARTSAPAAEVAALPPGAFLVQVSSQRSEDSALTTFRDLQARYPAILGSYQAVIQRADLGERGVYYRVRVGPFSGDDAERLCGDLKSAGGDCILARN
jgi:cell division septation protein DedD